MLRNFTPGHALLVPFALLFSTGATAQNLVPNPGFEAQDTCPAVSQIQLAPPWNSPTLGTPDLFNSTCSTQNTSAHTGIGCSGVYVYSTFANNREYIQAPLTSPLVAGQTYCVSFWVKRFNYRLASNRFGAYLSVGAVNQTTTSVLPFTPQVQNPSSNMLGGTSWIQISGSFTAAGGESHILIGSFATDAQTDTVVANAGNSSHVAIYAIDDVSVTACSVGVEELAGTPSLVVAPQPARDLMTVRLPASTDVRHPQVIDLSGRALPVPCVRTATGELEVTVSSLPTGTYVLAVEVDGVWLRQRFMVLN